MLPRLAKSYRRSTIATQPTTPSATPSLTPAETRVLRLLATYRTLAAIGDELGIGRPTVKTHVQHIYEKLGVNTRAEAVVRAELEGLLTTGERPSTGAAL
jgi:LuxR family maltose regulon positive regulatory protein